LNSHTRKKQRQTRTKTITNTYIGTYTQAHAAIHTRHGRTECSNVGHSDVCVPHGPVRVRWCSLYGWRNQVGCT